MKSILDTITESIVNEGIKDIYRPRKGSSVYLLKEGDTKAISVKITDTSYNKRAGFYDVKFAENIYNLEGYYYYKFNRDYNDPVMVYSVDNTMYYIGISSKSIQEFIRVVGKRQLDSILSRITDLEEDLKKAYKQKEEFEHKANIEISESLKQK